MQLALEKLRILTFPQHIEGDQLAINALLLPTQRLLNLTASFPSHLNPGTNVDLPNFITSNFTLELRALQGLSTYPFSEPLVLKNQGVTRETLATAAAFRPQLP